MARHDPEEVICLDDDEDDDDVQAITPPAQYHHQPPPRQDQRTFLDNIDLSKLPPHILERLAVGYLGRGGFRQTHSPSYEETLQTRSAKPGSEVTHGGQGRRGSGQSGGNALLTENLSSISGHDRVDPRLPDLRRSSLNSLLSQNEAAHQLQQGDPTIPSGATNVTPSSAPRISAALAIDGAALSPDLQVRNDEGTGMDTSSSVAEPSRGPLGVSGFRSFSVPLNTPPASRSGSPPPLTSAQNSLTSAQNSRPSSRDSAPPIRPSNTRPSSTECQTPPTPLIKQPETSIFAQPKGATDPKPTGANLFNSYVSSSRSQSSNASSHHEADPLTSTSHIGDRDSNRNLTKRDSFEGERRLADAPEVNLPLSPSVLKTYKQSFADKRRLQHELAEMMCKNNTLTGEIDNLNFEYMTLKNKLILSQAEVGVKDGRVDELETLLEQKENQLTSLNDELNKTIEELHHVQGVLDGRTDSEMPHGTPPINTFQVTEFLKELSEVKALNNRYQMNLVREHEKNSRLQRVIFEREKEIRRLENTQANKDTKIQSLEMQKLLMEDQVKHVKADAAKQVELPAAPNERITELKSQLKKAREELEKQTVHAKKCQLERNFMESVMAKGEATMKSLRQAVETKNSELEKTQNENVELKKKLMELEVRDIGTNASTEALKQLEQNLANEKLAKETANTAIQEVEKDNAKLRAELTSTKTRLTKTTNKFNDISEAHQKGMAELVSMTSQMRASQMVLGPLKAENQKLTEDFIKTSDQLFASENRCKIYYECQEEKDNYETLIVERDVLITRLKRQMVFYRKTATSHKKLMQSMLHLLHVFEDICQGLATQGGHQHQMTHQVFQKLLRMASVTGVAPPIGPGARSATETASGGKEEMPCPVTETEVVDAVATVTTTVPTPGKSPDDRTRNHPSSPKESTLKSPVTPKSSLMGALGLCKTPSIRTAGTSSQGLRAEDASPGQTATGSILGRNFPNSSFKDDNVIRVPRPGAPIRRVSDQEGSVGEVVTASSSGVTSRSIDSLQGTSSVRGSGEGRTMTERSGVRKDRTSGASSGVGLSESNTQQASQGISSGGIAASTCGDGTVSRGVVTGTGTDGTEEELLHESSTAPEPVTSSGQHEESDRVDVNDKSDYTTVMHPHGHDIDDIAEKDAAAIFPLETIEDVSLDGSNSMEEGKKSLILTLPDLPDDDPLETKYLLQKAIMEKQKEFKALGCMPGVRLNSSGEVEMFVDEGPIFIKSEVAGDVSVPSVQIKTELIETAGSPVVGESGEPGAQVTEDSCGNVEATLKEIYDILDKSKDIQARLSRCDVLDDAAVSGVSESVPMVQNIAEVVEKSVAAESPLENSGTKEDSVAEVVKEDRVINALEPGVLNSQVAVVREDQASGEKSLFATEEDEHRVTDPGDLSTQILNILEKKRQSDQVPSGSSLLIRQGAVPNFVALLKESVQALSQSGKTSNLDENEAKVNTDETLGTIERPPDVTLSGPEHSRIIEVDTSNNDSPIADSNIEAKTKQFRQSVDLEQDRERVGRASEGTDGNQIEKLQAQVDELLQSRKEIFELNVEMAETSAISKVDKALSSAQQSEQTPSNVNKHLSSAQEPTVARENVLVAKVGDLVAKKTKKVPEETGLVAKETVQVTRDHVTEDDTDDILSYKLNESNEKVDIAVHVSIVESDSDDEVVVIKTEKFSPRSEKGPKNVIETVTISDSDSDMQELDEISDAKSIEAEFPPLKSLDLGHFREVAGEEDFVAYEIKNMSSPVPDDSERYFREAQSPDDIPDIFDSQNSDYVGEFDESGAEFGLRTPSPELEEEGEEIEDQEEEEEQAAEERSGGREEEFLFERGGEEDHYVPEEDSVKLPRTSARSVGKYPRTAGQRLYQGLAMRGSKYEEAQQQKKVSSAQRLERNLDEEQEFCHSLLCRYFTSKKYRNLRATRGRKRGRGGKAVATASISRQDSREQLGQIIGEGANAGNQKQGQDGTSTRPSYGVDLPNSVSGDQSSGQNHPTELPHAFGINERWSHLHPVNAPGPSHGSGGGDHGTPPSSPAKPAWTHLGGTPWAPEGSTPVTSGQQRKGQPSKKKSIWVQNRESIRGQFTKGALKPKKSLKSGTLLNFSACRPYMHPLLKNQAATEILCDVNINDAALAQVFNSARQASTNVNKHLSSAQQSKQAPSNVDKHLSLTPQREQAQSNANKHLPSAKRSEQTTAGPTALNVNTNLTHAALPHPVDTSIPGLDDVLASMTSQCHSSSGVSEPPGEQTLSQADSGKTMESATAIPNKEQDQIGFGHTDFEPGVSAHGDSLDKELRDSREGSVSSIASDELEFLNQVDTSNTMAPQNCTVEQATAPEVSRATKPSDAGGKSRATISDAGRKLQAKVTKTSGSLTFQSTSRCDAEVSQSGGEETSKQKEVAGEKVKTGYGKLMLEHQKVCKNVGADFSKKNCIGQGMAAEMRINKAERETVQTSLENVRKSQEASTGLEKDGIDARTVREKITSAQEKHEVQAETLREMTRVESEAMRPKTVPEKTRLESEEGRVTAKTIQEEGPFRQEEDRVDSNAEQEKAGSEGGKVGEGVCEQASAEQEKDRVTITAEHEKVKAAETERKLEKRRVEQLETIKRYRVDATERRCENVRKKHHQADKDYERSRDDFASIQMRQKNARSYGERSRLDHLANNAIRRERLAAETLQYLKLDLDRAVVEHQAAKEELDQFLKRSSENVAREKEKEQSTAEPKKVVEKSATTQEDIVDKPGDRPDVLQHVIKISPNKIVLKKAEPPRSESKGQTEKCEDLSAVVNPRVAAEVLDGKTVAVVGKNKCVLKSPTKKVGLYVGKDAPVQKAAGVVEEKSRAETDDVTCSEHTKSRTEMNVGSGRDHRNKPGAGVTEVKEAAATLGAGSDPINPATKVAMASLRTDSSPSVPQTKEVAASKATSDSATAGTVAASSIAILTNQDLLSLCPLICTPSLGKRKGMIDWKPWLGKTVSDSATSTVYKTVSGCDAVAEGDHGLGGKRDDKDGDRGRREMKKTRKDSMEAGKSDEDRNANIGLAPKLADNVLDEYLDGLEDVSDVEAKDTEKQSAKFETLDSFLDNLEDVGLEKEGVAQNDDDDEEEEEEEDDGAKEEVEGSVADDRTSDEDSDGMSNIGGEEAERESGAEEEEEDEHDDRDDDAEGDTKKTGEEQSVDKLDCDITDDQSIDVNFEEKSADDLTGTGGEWDATCADVSDNEDLEALRADSDGLEDISDAELEFSQRSGSGTPLRMNSPRVKGTGDYLVQDEVSRKGEIIEECSQLGKKLEKAKEIMRKVEQTKMGGKSNSKTKDDEIVKNTASVKECLNLSPLSRSRSFDEADVSFMTSDISEDESDLEFNLEESPGYPPTPPRFPPGFDLRLVLNTRHKLDGHVSQEETVEVAALSHIHGSNTSCEGSCFCYKCPDLKITCDFSEEEQILTMSDSDPDSETTGELEVDDKIQSRRLQNLKEPSVKRSTQDVNKSTRDGKGYVRDWKRSAHDGKRSGQDGKKCMLDEKRSAHYVKRSGNMTTQKAKDLTKEEKAEKLRRSLAEIDARLKETRKKRKKSQADEESQHTKIKPSRRESFENEPRIFHRPKRPRSPYSRSRRLSLSRQSPARSLATHSVNKAKTYQTRDPKVSGSYNFDCKTGRWYWDSESGFLPQQLDSGEQQTSELEAEDRVDVVAIEANLENPRCMEVESPDDSPESPEPVTETPQSPDSNPHTDATNTSLVMTVPLSRDNTPDIENIRIKPSTGNDMLKKTPDADTPKSPDARKCPIGVGLPGYGSVDPKPIPSSPIRARLSSPVRARQNSSIKANTLAGAEPKLPIGHGTSETVTADAMSIGSVDKQEPQTLVSNGKTKSIGSPKPKKNTMKNRPRSPVGVGSVAGSGENVQKGGEPLNIAVPVESKTSDAIGRSPSQKKKRLRNRKRKENRSPAQGELGCAAEPGCTEATETMLKKIYTSPITSIDLVESDVPGESAAEHEPKKKKQRRKRKNLGPSSPPRTFTVAKAVLALRDGTFTQSVSDSKCAKLSFTGMKPADKSANLDRSNADTAKTNIAASMKQDASALKPSPSRMRATELESKSVVGESSKGDSEIRQKNTFEAKEMKQTGSVGEILRPNRSRRDRSMDARSAEISRSGRRDVSPRHRSGSPSPRSERKNLRSDPRSIERDSRSGTKSKSPSCESDANLRHLALSGRSRPSRYHYSRGDRSRVDLRSSNLKNQDRERRDRLDLQFERDRSRSRVYQSGFYRYNRSKSPSTIRRERNRELTPIPRKRKLSDFDLKPPNSGKILKTGEKRSSSERLGQSLRNLDKVAGPAECENADRATSAAKGIPKPRPQDDADKVSSPRKRDAADHAEGLRPIPPLREKGEKVSNPGKRGEAGCALAAAPGSKRSTLPDDKLLSETGGDRASAGKSDGEDQNVSGLAAYVKNEKWKLSPHKTPESRRIAEAYQDKNKQTSEVYVVPTCHGLGRSSSHLLGNSKNCLRCCAKRKELGLKAVCQIPVKRVAAKSGPVTPAQIFAKSVEMPVFGEKMSTGPSTAVDNTAGVLNSGVEKKESEQVSLPSAAGGDFGIVKLVQTYGESEKTGKKMNDILTNILEGMQKTGRKRNCARAGQNLLEDVQNSAPGAEGDGQGASKHPRETRSNTKNLSSFWKL